jgi:hypothetical protein
MNVSLNIEDEGNVQIIKISDFNLPYVEDYQDGIKTGEGYHSHEAIANAFKPPVELGSFATPILPRGTLYYSEVTDGSKCTCFLEIAPHRRSIYYHEALVDEVPFPRLVFGFELLHRGDEYVITRAFLGACESYGVLNEDSEIYLFPYSNVRSDFVVCWGGTERPILTRISQLTTIPELFFNSTNSDCYYNTANSSNLPYRELLETLKGKDFPEEYLKKSGKTLFKWVNELI